jgi:hypothetical protein
VVEPGTSVRLTSGQEIELGGLRFAFFDSAAMKARVSGVPLRSAR